MIERDRRVDAVEDGVSIARTIGEIGSRVRRANEKIEDALL
jgi:hypothetical protein